METTMILAAIIASLATNLIRDYALKRSLMKRGLYVPWALHENKVNFEIEVNLHEPSSRSLRIFKEAIRQQEKVADKGEYRESNR